jgi:hypothetical protein
MDVVEQLLHRLQRIEQFGSGSQAQGEAGRRALVDELRQLVGEAEAWARSEGDRRAREAVDKLRGEAEGMH